MKYGVKILAQDLPGTEFSDVVSFLLCPESKGAFPLQSLAKGARSQDGWSVVAALGRRETVAGVIRFKSLRNDLLTC